MIGALYLPEEASELEKELRQITKEKNEVVRGQGIEKIYFLPCTNAPLFLTIMHLCSQMDLNTQISALVDKSKETSKAETEAGEEGPTVTEADIQYVVLSWATYQLRKSQ
ncbi:CLPC-like protein [Artemisia annua]|uniref:CLPC-like protein n=1 Tax=Artemisia annua TaxID=35608 RepID=A0A2U1N8E4_ARTAN|nr:CLPC-like protein [Artemisia annua]